MYISAKVFAEIFVNSILTVTLHTGVIQLRDKVNRQSSHCKPLDIELVYKTKRDRDERYFKFTYFLVKFATAGWARKYGLSQKPCDVLHTLFHPYKLEHLWMESKMCGLASTISYNEQFSDELWRELISNCSIFT